MNVRAQEQIVSALLTREDYLRAYMDGGWEQVPGWLYDGARQVIRMTDIFQKQRGIEGHIGEIGLFRGKLFIMLALMARDQEKVFGVDLFGTFQSEGDDRLSVIHENMRQHMGEYPWVDILTSDSTLVTAAQLQEQVDGKYRLFSVDGGHQEPVVFHDLSIAAESLAPGGVILLDDYFDPGNPEVSVATCRYFAQGDSLIAPFAIAGNKVFFCEKHAHEAYYQQFSSIAQHAVRNHNMMFGAKIIVYQV